MLQALHLSYFRNHTELYHDIEKRIVLLYGDNGTGKTSVLESFSLLLPGKGFRASSLDEISSSYYSHQQMDFDSAKTLKWQASFRFSDRHDIDHTLKCHYQGKNKTVTLDGNRLRSYKDIGYWAKPVWFIPQMHNLFNGEAAERRSFFDRYIYNIYPEHGDDYLHYQKLLKSRMTLLREGSFDQKWIETLEKQLSYDAIKIAARRLIMMRRLSEEILLTNVKDQGYPIPLVRVAGQVEDLIIQKHGDRLSSLCDDQSISMEAALLEEVLKNWKNYRQKDAITKRSNYGVHRSDFITVDRESKRDAKHCSTGEQKFLLFTMVITQALTISAQFPDAMVLLLLDDVMAYLDPDRQKEVLRHLAKLPIHTWITTADPLVFEEININNDDYHCQIIHL